MAQQPNIITTPKGLALYPWLSTPDTKYSEEGEYKVNLVLSKEDAQPIVDEINRIFAENLAAETKKQGKEIKTANPPYADQLNDAGQPTGNVIFRFKSKAAYKPSNFDAKGTTMIESNIWGGSEIRVNGTIAPYFTSLVGAGIALRLRAVQVIKLVEGSGEGASRFGFDETAGYVHNAPDAGAEVFEEGGAPSPIMEATPAGKAGAIARNPDQVFMGNAANVVPVAEPEIVKVVSSNEGGKDIAELVTKWGAKD